MFKVSQEVDEEFAPVALAANPKPKDKECSCAIIPVRTTPAAARETPLLAGCILHKGKFRAAKHHQRVFPLRQLVKFLRGMTI